MRHNLGRKLPVHSARLNLEGGPSIIAADQNAVPPEIALTLRLDTADMQVGGPPDAPSLLCPR